MGSSRSGGLVWASWLAMMLGMGSLGCSSLKFLESPRSTAGLSRVADNPSDSGRSDLVRTSFSPLSSLKPGAEEASEVKTDRPSVEGSGEPEPLMPCELAKTSLPPYLIEPPDVLTIDTIRLVPRMPYHLEPLDVLLVQVAETLPRQPIAGPFVISPDGVVNLGPSYGIVRVAGLTLEQAAQVIQQHLKQTLRNPQVAVALTQFHGGQQIRGKHLVQMDGTITLGRYGCVHVTGKTVEQAQHSIETHLSRWLIDPEISLRVSAFNSKVYYVVLDGGRHGQQVFRFPITGNETVLDAISRINGLPPMGAAPRIWVARPTPAKACCYEILPVNWQVLTQVGDTETNYQLFPGDRIYVKARRLLPLPARLTLAVGP